MKPYYLFLLIIPAFFVGRYLGNPSTCVAFCEAVQIRQLTATEFANTIEQNNPTVIDIRTQEEFQTGHIANALNIDFYQTQNFSDYLDKLDKKKPYLIYCRSGNRTNQALELMKAKGFTDVAELQGGIQSWELAKLPLTQN